LTEEERAVGAEDEVDWGVDEAAGDDSVDANLEGSFKVEEEDS
jgi:hypothetical protein